MSRSFNDWLATMSDSVATWNYYTDFEKIYKNVDSIKVELNILNSLIGSDNIQEDFVKLLNDYPNVLKVVPILLAKRGRYVQIRDIEKTYQFDFQNMNYKIQEYVQFMEQTGLFDLIANHSIANLYDYVTGVETGLDSNARKNRTGDIMEDLVEAYILQYGFIKHETYFKEMYKSEIEKKWNIDLSPISNNGKTEKRFDFVIKTNNQIYAIEVNYYSGGGSKLNETARSYKNIAIESSSLKDFTFIWITDGKGWLSAKHNLEETFDLEPNLFNLNDLENNILYETLK